MFKQCRVYRDFKVCADNTGRRASPKTRIGHSWARRPTQGRRSTIEGQIAGHIRRGDLKLSPSIDTEQQLVLSFRFCTSSITWCRLSLSDPACSGAGCLSQGARKGRPAMAPRRQTGYAALLEARIPARSTIKGRRSFRVMRFISEPFPAIVAAKLLVRFGYCSRHSIDN